MQGTARLGVDIGAATTAAILSTSDGVRLPLLFDGSPTMPTGVCVGADGSVLAGTAGPAAAATGDANGYVASSLAVLATGVTVDGRQVDGVDLVAALLRRVADTARAAGASPEAVSLTVPPGWGPHRRQLIAQAAARAGLPAPDLVAAPVAVADHLAAVTGDPPPVGACVLVYDATPTAPQLTVLQRDPTAMTVLATTSATGEPDGADHTDTPTPAAEQLPAQVGEVLHAADVIPSHLAAVILTGAGAHQPGLADALTAATGRAVLIPANPALAAADGATRTPTRPGLTTPSGARLRLTLWHLAVPALLAAASLALFVQFLASEEPGERFRSYGVPIHQIAAAGLLAALTALAVAHLAPTVWLTGPDAGPISPALMRRVYTGAALIGITISAVYGMAASTYFGLIGTPYLAGPILAALPTTAFTLATALLAGRIPAPAMPAWLAKVRHPPVMPLLAAAGLMLMTHEMNGPPIFPGFSLIGYAGAAILGAATAGTITRQPTLRAVTMPFLALSGAAVYNFFNIPNLTLAYLTAAGWWALTATATTFHAAFPAAGTTLREILDNATKTSPTPPAQ